VRSRRLTHLVTKDSGGPDAKLHAARITAIPVILLRRPGTGGSVVHSSDDVIDLLSN
jgi:precorrin-6x reductase